FVVLNGRWVYCGKYGTPEAEEKYRSVLGTWLATGISQVEPWTVTIGELAVGYLKHCRQYYRKPDRTPTSELNTITNALKLLLQTYRHTPANDFGPLKLKAVREQMIEAGLMRTTINGNVQRIVRM